MSDYKYKACYMTDLAKKASVPATTFQDWFGREDWKALLDLGFLPHRRKLSPPVVKYISEKFLPDVEK